tara:strand:- start:44 stop:271 length:228 start_codon:yes stop_codon:yes gene_type:complete
MLLHTTLGYLSFLFINTLNYNHSKNKAKTKMSLFAQKLKTPNRRADDFGVLHASQTQKSQLSLASKTNNSTSLEL